MNAGARAANVRAMATAGGSSEMDTDPAGGAGFALLAAAHAGLAATAPLAPAALVNAFFPGAALPQGMQSQALTQLLSGGLALGAASCWALKQAADAGQLKTPTAQRL
jgi:hypothetical protein